MSVVASSALAGASGQATGTSYEIKKGLRFNDSDGAVLKRTPSTVSNRRTWTYSCWFKRSRQGSTLYQHLIDANDGSTYFDVQIYPDGEIGVFYNPSGSQYVVPSALYRDFSAWYHFVLAIDTTQTTDSDRVKIYINGVRETEFGTSSWPAQDAELMINSTAEHEIGGRNGTGFNYFGGYMADSYLIDGSAVDASVFGEFDTDGVWQPKKVTEAALITAKESQQPYNTRDNMAQEWSAGTSSNFYIGVDKLFNGDHSDAAVPNTNANAEHTFSTSFNSSKIEALVQYGNNTGVEYGVMVGGTWHNVLASQIPNNNQQWVTLYEGSEGSVTKIRVQCGSSGGGSFVALKSNGRELVDGPADNSKLWSATAIRSDWAAANPASQLFDGSLSNYTYSLGGSYEQITWDAITATSSVEVYGRGTTDSWRMIIDGSPVSVVFSGNTVSDNSWRTVSTSFPCSVTGIENNNPGACYAVRIDGKILVNAPSQYNASKTWSKYLTSPAGFSSGRYPDRAFYGTDSSDFAATPSNVSGESNAIEFTPPTTIAYTTLEVRGRGTDQTTFSVKIDTGSGYGSAITSTGDKWQTIATSGTLTKLKLWTTSYAGENEFGGIRIDGKVLVDGGWGTNGFHLPFDDGTDIGKDTAPTAPALDPRGGFDAVAYTGTGTYNQVSNVRFAPDLVWIKDRSAGNHHYLVDSVRGVGTSEALFPDRTVAAGDGTQRVSSLNSDGFSVFGTYGYTNTSGSNYVAWCWKAGGDAVSNTDGTITSTVSADQNYGFSVVKATAPSSSISFTLGHGLNAAPKFIIFRELTASNWAVYHSGLASAETKYLHLNSANAAGTSNVWNDTAPTSSVFSSAMSGNWSSGADLIAYCWSEVSGYSKFGTWTGTGVSGHKITTGFRPAFLLVKRTDTTGYWNIVDIERGGGKALHPNLSNAESVGGPWVTFNDDGFTLTTTGSGYNDSGATFVYAAFADYPGNNFTPQNLITEENTASKNNFAATTYAGNGHNLSVGGQRFSTLSTVTGGTLSNAINAFNGSGSNWATLAATNTSTAAAVDFNFSTPITGVTRVEMAFDSPSASGDTRGRFNGANGGATRTGTSSGYSDVYNGSAITLTSVGWAINQNSTTGTSSDIVSRIRITDSIGTYFLIDGEGEIGFQPDLVWYKHRSAASSHGLFDSVRGTTKYLSSNSNSAESTVSGVTSFNSDGFSLGSDSGSNGVGTWAAWCWKAGGAASSNTNGTITSSVSANPNFGFSIVSWSAQSSAGTVGHGLSSPPKFILMKTRDQSGSWITYHDSVGTQQYFVLDSTAVPSSNNLVYTTAPTSSVFSPGDGIVNTSAYGDMIAYCWSEVSGYSRFSSYVGNGSSGNKVTLGFKPRWVMIKCTSTASQEWCIFDTARNPSNPADLYIYANYSNAEGSYSNRKINVLSDGFEFYGSDAAVNNSGDKYIYAAFGEPAYVDLDLVNDTPTANAEDPVKGNYATLNTIDSNIGANLNNGNLSAAGSSNWSAGHARGNFRLTSGKWYWEVTKTGGSGSTAQIGFCNKAFSLTTSYGSLPADSWTFNFGNGTEILMPSGGGGSYFSGSAMVDGDVAGIALDMDAGTAIFYKNNIAGASISLSSTKTGSTNNITELFPLVGVYNANVSVNFGQQPFKYTPPTGYKSLCTTNLPDPTIEDGSKHFDVKLWNGNNVDPRSITTSFGPDLVWIKTRNQTNWHSLTDSVRGAPKKLYSNSTTAEDTTPIYGQIDSFNSDGFTLGGGTDGSNPLSDSNQSGTSYVAWAWDAGTSNTSISAGSLNSSTYNTSAVWSNALTASTLKTATAGFNGDISSGRSEGTGGLTFTPSGGISVSSSVEVYDNNSVTKSRVTVNNVQQSDVQHVASNWVTVFTGSGTLNSLYNERTDNSGWDAGFYALRIDGKILVDSNITPANVPALASTVRANPSAGFSVVSWTGARNAGDTVAHGLNAVPELVIVKNRDQSTNWMTYHKASGAAGYLALNLTNAYAAASTVWNSTAPDSSVFTLGADSESNGDGDDMIAYCFAPVAGYSAFGSYTGNGSTDGPFVYTGFRPAFIMIKRTDSTGWWQMWDSSRNKYNEVDHVLGANVSNAEFTGSATGDRFDFLSNGFKVRGSNNDLNGSNGSFAYVCFAENPFKTARAR